jgi:hypothetical protein
MAGVAFAPFAQSIILEPVSSSGGGRHHPALASLIFTGRQET